jgi:hypothetical protein
MFVVKDCICILYKANLVFDGTYVLFLMFYFWQFPLPYRRHALKSILVTLAYVYVNYKFVISIEINEVIDSVFRNWTLNCNVYTLKGLLIIISVSLICCLFDDTNLYNLIVNCFTNIESLYALSFFFALKFLGFPFLLFSFILFVFYFIVVSCFVRQ